MNRREFVKTASVAVGAIWASRSLLNGALPDATASRLPCWRGFNLIDLLGDRPDARVHEEDFAWMAEWGFNYVRLPLSYHLWSNPAKWHEVREEGLRVIDEALRFGGRYRCHVSLCLHRAPGYSVDRGSPEPFDLWRDSEALDACAYHWRQLATRYKEAPNSRLSFNLLNEPALTAAGEPVEDAMYARVIQRLAEDIRAESPDRLLVADGLGWARIPVPQLAPLCIAQSVHAYDPMRLTHWKADWVEGAAQWPTPTWPLPAGSDRSTQDRNLVDFIGQRFRDNSIAVELFADPALTTDWNSERLQRQLIRPWQEIEAQNVGVHIGEFGVHNRTPHRVTLAWIADLLGAAKKAGWGWAMWNLRGAFGVLDSERTDVAYEKFHGHQLDRRMLELLRES